MKIKIFIVVIGILMFSACCFGEDIFPTGNSITGTTLEGSTGYLTATELLKPAQSFCEITLDCGQYDHCESIVKQMAEQGEICKIYGHMWENTTPNFIYTTCPPQYPPATRKCSICGKSQVEKKTKSEWVDVKE